MTNEERTLMDEAFEMGRQSVTYRISDLERRERDVQAAEERLRVKAIVLGVAEYALERDVLDRATVLTVRWHDHDMREAAHLSPAAMVDMVKPQIDATRP